MSLDRLGPGGVTESMNALAVAGGVPLGKNGRFTSPPQEKGVPEGRDPKEKGGGELPEGGITGEGEAASWTIAEGDRKRAEARLRRFGMQAGARCLLPDQKGIQGCLRWRRHQCESIDLYHKPLTRSARYGGLQTCGSVWMCPVCAAKITEVRRVEIGEAVRRWWDQGGTVVLCSYTMRHRLGDALGELVGGLSEARGISTGGKGGKLIYRRHSVEGSIRALEVTHGENGWHPHVHELLFLSGSQDLELLGQELRDRWSYSVQKAGLREVNEHGFDLRVGRRDIQEYIAKHGCEPWGVEHELTKQPAKVSRSAKGRSPMQLLADFSFDADIQAGSLFVEYAREMKGRRQLFWSKGLRARLIPGAAELTDEEIAADVDDLCEELLARFDLLQWQRIQWTESQAELLNLAASRDVNGLRICLESIGVRGAVLETPERTDRARRKPQARSARSAAQETQEEPQCAMDLVCV